MDDRYGADVLAKGWQGHGVRQLPRVAASRDLVVEVAADGYCGAVVGIEQGSVALEDRHGRRRLFPLGAGFLVDGADVVLTAPAAAVDTAPRRTASGSFAAPEARARTARASRILVEGRHDAELVEKVWGDDLRHVGVVVEYLGGIDDLPAIVTEFAPQQGRRLGVLVDHLVPGSKESRIVEQVGNPWLFVTGHRFIDIWTAVKPSVLGLKAWPNVPRGQDYKAGLCRALGWPARTQADIAEAWRHIRSKVTSWRDLDPALLTEVEKLIDFVTADHADTLEP